jgi:hypothetical protein
MSLKDEMVEISRSFPAPLAEQKDGSLLTEFVVAERKSFLSRKKLTYKCHLRVVDGEKAVRFYEIIKESGFGLSGSDGMEAGFSFKKETYSTRGKERDGSVEEQSRLFGKDYSYSFDFGAIRHALQQTADKEGYSFSVHLREGSV